MIHPKLFTFFRKLDKNNSKAWFNPRKPQFPLKTNMSGLVAGGPEGPFYYLQVGPGQTLAGGGIYVPSAPLLRAIREELEESYQDLESVVTSSEFKKMFPKGLKTEFEVKTAPRGYRVDHPAIEYLRKKSFTVTREFTDKEAQSDDFYENLIQTFEVQHNLNRYLQRAFHRLEDKKVLL